MSDNESVIVATDELHPVVEATSELPEATEATAELPKYSAVELEAIKQGWRPKSEFQGDESDFVGAEAYIAKGPLIKKNKELEKAIKEMQANFAKTEKLVYERAKKELEAEANKAWATGDQAAYTKAQQELQELKPVSQQSTNPMDNPIVKEYIAVNKFIMTPVTDLDYKMRGIALAASDYHAAQFPNATPEEAIAYIDNALNETFPQRNKNPNREAPSAVAAIKPKAGAPATTHKGPHPEYHKLTDVQKMIGQQLTDSKYGKYTWDQYIKQLKDDNRL